jgi:prepilin-type N-terminal cleavage/methylation domain-containing protein
MHSEHAPAQTRRPADEGFGLVELLVVMLLLTIVGAIAIAGIVQGMRTTAHGEDRVQALSAAQTGIERLSRELRAADPLTVADSDHVEVAIRRDDRLFYYIYKSEENGDLWDLTEERWQFDDAEEFDDPGFVPTAAGADAVTSRVLVRSMVDKDVFTFLTAGGTQTTNPGLARQADIQVRRLVQPGRSPIIVQTTVQMRNA